MAPSLESLFSPLALGPAEIPNRIVSTAHQTTLVADHAPTDDFVAYHEARARGGTGLIVLEATAVHPSGLLTAHTLGGYRDEIAADYERVAKAVQPHGTKLFVQLFHGGREQIASAPRPPAVAPSPVPTQRFHVEPRPLRADEIEAIVAGYARAARLAERGGLDGVEISAAHGYLIAQFFTPELNRREDEWAEPGRFLGAVVRAVREAAARLAIGVRLSADSDAARSVVGELRGLVDYVHVALGDSSTYRGAAGIVPPPPVIENAIVPFASPFRIGVPLVATSRIVDPVEADRLVEEGRLDAVGMTRALITDPDLPRKASAGRADEVLRCIGCNACIAHYHAETPIACAQNPRTGRERTLPRPEPSADGRRIVVVGAGPAGLAAAAEGVAAGHDVVVLERSAKIGGQIALAAAAPAHTEIARSLVANYERLLVGRAELRLETEADLESIEALRPQAVIVAAGARPYRPPLDLAALDVRQAWDVFAGERPHGARVVVADWGGDASGLAVAELLDAEGNEVTLAVASSTVGEALHQYTRNLYLARLYRAGVRIEQHLELAGAESGSAFFVNTFAPEVDAALPADILVLALGRTPLSDLAPSLLGRGLPIEEAGDCLSPRSLEEAILEGTLAARRVVERASADALR
jgi:2,4-dienoyl-CoA reductase-like NADH-dependent reductase (Old Yellow Enzyme family)/thioredoxin reductase